jgi:hypothetical protein
LIRSIDESAREALDLLNDKSENIPNADSHKKRKVKALKP